MNTELSEPEAERLRQGLNEALPAPPPMHSLAERAVSRSRSRQRRFRVAAGVATVVVLAGQVPESSRPSTTRPTPVPPAKRRQAHPSVTDSPARQLETG